jgi:hypothetical protein
MNNDASLLAGPHRPWRSTKRPNDRLPAAEGVPALCTSAGSKGSKRNTQRSAERRASPATRPRAWRRALSMAEVGCAHWPSSVAPAPAAIEAADPKMPRRRTDDP